MEEILGIVFRERKYIYLAVVLAIAIGFLFSVSMGLVYLTPLFFVNSYQFFSEGIINTMLNIAFLTIAPIFASLTITLIVYRISGIKRGVGKETGAGIGGIFSALFVSTCPQCVPLVLYSVGVTYGLYTAVFASWIEPIKTLTLLLFFLSFYFATNGVAKYCKIRR